MKILLHLTYILFALSIVPAHAADVASPDGRIMVTIDADGEGIVFYTITRDGKPLIDKSNLGFNFTDADPMRRNFAVEREDRGSVDTRWEQPWGERQWVRDHHNELALSFVEKAAQPRRFTVRIRVFDGGVGLRSEFAADIGKGATRIADELTEFNISPERAVGGTAWWIRAGDWNRYEYLYAKTDIAQIGMAHTPATMRLSDGTHLAFHEAALVDYSAMWLRRMEGSRFRVQLSPSSQGAKVVRHGAFMTPWRTLRIADGPAGLVENDLELNLNEPNKLGDVSWFRPHKYVGIWWEMHLESASWASGATHGATTANAMKYIDFAAANGFRGVLIEGWNKGWDGNWFGNGRDFSFTQAYPDFDLKAVAAYARKRGVRLIGHHETGGNIANYEDQLEDAMALYATLGVDSVKTGYVADAGGIIARSPDGATEVFEWHDGQRMVQHHLAVVKAAARYRIAVNPHEPVKDTGLRRTYPNWVAREGARGAEYDAWGVPKNLPSHVPSLVYTRLLAGPMDYTPGVLSLEGRGGSPIPSTLARQLAFYVVIYSPIQMAADLPENLSRYPRELAFIRKVPADWAESRLVDGAVGEYAVFARKDRNSAAWYVGGVTDEKARTSVVKLDFLEPGRRYTATIWRDGDGADGLGPQEAKHRIVIETRTVSRDDVLTLA
ncbi:MAG: hypothetical protein RLZZ58_1907, partial [Pseudomonadota bacterium]